MGLKRVNGKVARKRRRCKFAQCQAWFTPGRRNQVHCCPEHRNAEAQRKWRVKAQTALQQVAS